MLNQNAGFAVGHQAAKGTAAASYIAGRMSTSGANTAYDRTDNAGEHTPTHERPTIRRSTAIRTGAMVNFNVAGRVYPYLLPMLLLGLGMKIATAGTSPAYTHTETIADADEVKYLSILRQLGEGSERFSKLITDAKLAALNMTADRNGITYNGSGMGIYMADAAGTEAVTVDPDIALSQALGSFTLTSSDLTANTIGTPRSMAINFASRLDAESQKLHSMRRAELIGDLDITGSFTGLDFSEDAEAELQYGGGANEVIKIPEAQISWVWQTPSNIPNGAVPYKMTWTIPKVQITMQPVDVTGNGRILYNANWEMIDAASGAPFTLATVNNLADYAAD